MAGDVYPVGLVQWQQEQAKTVNADPIKVAEHSAGAMIYQGVPDDRCGPPGHAAGGFSARRTDRAGCGGIANCR